MRTRDHQIFSEYKETLDETFFPIPLKAWFEGFEGFLDTLCNKRNCNLDRDLSSENYLQVYPFLIFPSIWEAYRCIILNENLPGFITLESSNHPFSIESKTLILVIKNPHSTSGMRKVAYIPCHSMETSFLAIRSPIKIIKKLVQFLVAYLRRGLMRGIVHMNRSKDIQKYLVPPYKWKHFGSPILDLFFNLLNNKVPMLTNGSLKGKGNTKKFKYLTRMNPFPRKEAKPLRHRCWWLYEEGSFLPLNTRAKGTLKIFKHSKVDRIDFSSLRRVKKVISKMVINELKGGVRQSNYSNHTL